MAQSSVEQEAMSCPLCLVPAACGHSFCMDCIKDWDQQSLSYSCPQCRQRLSPRPGLGKNSMLANVVQQKKKKPGLKTPPKKLQENICPQHNKVKKMFCCKDQEFICSLCSATQHQGHRTVTAAAERARREAELLDRRTLLLQSLQHKETELDKLRQKAKDISRSAQTAVQLSGDSFREMALLLEKRRSEAEQQIQSEEQSQLRPVLDLQDQLQRDITELKRNICDLDTLSLTADHSQLLQRCPPPSTDSQRTQRTQQSPQRCPSPSTDSQRTQQSLQRCPPPSTDSQRTQQSLQRCPPPSTDSQRTQRTQQSLQRCPPPSTDSQRTQQSLQRCPPPSTDSQRTQQSPQRCPPPSTDSQRTQQSLQRCPPPSTDSQRTESSRFQTEPLHRFEEVTSAVSALRDELQLTLEEKQSPAVFKWPAFLELKPGPEQVLLPAEPTTRQDFLRCYTNITLDPNTAHKYLSLCKPKRRGRFVSKKARYPKHKDRFSLFEQALSRERLRGRCYWELEWSGMSVHVAASYRDVQRKSPFGHNNQSWALVCDTSRYLFYFNSVKSEVSGPISSRIGVYLDHSAGALSFYSVQDETMTLLHRVQTTFTRPLYAGVLTVSTVRFPKLQ